MCFNLVRGFLVLFWVGFFSWKKRNLLPFIFIAIFSPPCSLSPLLFLRILATFISCFSLWATDLKPFSWQSLTFPLRFIHRWSMWSGAGGAWEASCSGERCWSCLPGAQQLHPAPNLALYPHPSIKKQSSLAWNYLLLAHLFSKCTVIGLLCIFLFPLNFAPLLTRNV